MVLYAASLMPECFVLILLLRWLKLRSEAISIPRYRAPYRIKDLAMHDVGTVEGPFRPSDVQCLALRRIKFHIPYLFPFLKYVQIILKLCSILLSMYHQIYIPSNIQQYHQQTDELEIANCRAGLWYTVKIRFDPGQTHGEPLMILVVRLSFLHQGLLSDFFPLGRIQPIWVPCLEHHALAVYAEVWNEMVYLVKGFAKVKQN